jgi:hypothetical protein
MYIGILVTNFTNNRKVRGRALYILVDMSKGESVISGKAILSLFLVLKLCNSFTLVFLNHSSFIYTT